MVFPPSSGVKLSGVTLLFSWLTKEWRHQRILLCRTRAPIVSLFCFSPPIVFYRFYFALVFLPLAWSLQTPVFLIKESSPCIDKCGRIVFPPIYKQVVTWKLTWPVTIWMIFLHSYLTCPWMSGNSIYNSLPGNSVWQTEFWLKALRVKALLPLPCFSQLLWAVGFCWDPVSPAFRDSAEIWCCEVFLLLYIIIPLLFHPSHQVNVRKIG